MSHKVLPVFIVLLLLTIFPLTFLTLYFQIHTWILAGYMNGCMFLVLGFTHKRFKSPETLQQAKEKARKMGKANGGKKQTPKLIEKRISPLRGRKQPQWVIDKRTKARAETILRNGGLLTTSPKKGLTYEQYYGIERAKGIKHKISINQPSRKTLKDRLRKFLGINKGEDFNPVQFNEHKFAREVLIEKTHNYSFIESTNGCREHPTRYNKEREKWWIPTGVFPYPTDVVYPQQAGRQEATPTSS